MHDSGMLSSIFTDNSLDRFEVKRPIFAFLFYIQLYQSPLSSWQREVPIIYCLRYYPNWTNYNKPWDGL